MKKILSIVCLAMILAGCQQPAQENQAGNGRQEAAKKMFAQSMMLLQQKDLKGAVTSLEDSIKLDPSDPNPYLVLGQILLKAGEFQHASEFLDQTAKTFPNNGTVFYMLSVSNRMAGKKLPAVLAARRSYEIFNAAGDTASAQNSAILLEELIKEAQEQDKTAASTGDTNKKETAAPSKK